MQGAVCLVGLGVGMATLLCVYVRDGRPVEGASSLLLCEHRHWPRSFQDLGHNYAPHFQKLSMDFPSHPHGPSVSAPHPSQAVPASSLPHALSDLLTDCLRFALYHCCLTHCSHSASIVLSPAHIAVTPGASLSGEGRVEVRGMR